MKRIFWIVLDSAGIGEAPDADQFGDVGSNTWKSCYDSGKLHIPNMEKIGIYQIDGMDPEFPGRLDQFSLRFIQCMLIGNLLFGRNYFLTGSAPVILITDSSNF